MPFYVVQNEDQILKGSIYYEKYREKYRKRN